MRRPLLCALALLLAACAGPSPADLPRDEPYLVVVKSARLPAYTGVVASQAHHTWFELKRGAEDDWERLEVLSRAAYSEEDVLRRLLIPAEMARAETRWGHRVHVHRVLRGDEAREAIQGLEAAASDYDDAANYWAYPGPNSNTFTERLARAAGVGYEAHHNAIGKDWAWLRAGPTATGSGLELETPLLGLQVGLEEGLELHVIQLTFGLDLWPPALKLPFLPRLGF